MDGQRDWTIVIPVKELAAAKSRLTDIPGLSAAARMSIALAFACDTVATACACSVVKSVLVVTADADVAARVRALGAEVVDEIDEGLNAAVRLGEEAARRAGAKHVAALVGDLPALRSHELADALKSAPTSGRFHVSDANDLGTTLLGGNGEPLDPAFGVQSNQRHVDSGSVQLNLAAASLRLDVDTRGDLRRAAELGTGNHTTRWLAVALAGATEPTPDGAPITIRTAPGLSEHSPMTAFLADGAVVSLGADTNQNLRPGQRIAGAPTPQRHRDF